MYKSCQLTKKRSARELVQGVKMQILNVDLKVDCGGWEHLNIISPFSRLIMVLDGTVEVEYHGRIYLLVKNSLHLIPCFTEASIRCPEGATYYFAHFTSRLEGGGDLWTECHCEYQVESDSESKQLFAELIQLLPDRGLQEFRPHSCEEKRSVLNRLSNTEFKESAGVLLAAGGVFRQLLIPFIASIELDVSAASGVYSTILVYIDANLCRAFSINELAEVVRITPQALSCLFKRVFGTRPKEFIVYRRIELALGMLVAGTHSLKEISFATGFNDAAYFSRTFKRCTGLTPSQYQHSA